MTSQVCSGILVGGEGSPTSAQERELGKGEKTYQPSDEKWVRKPLSILVGPFYSIVYVNLQFKLCFALYFNKTGVHTSVTDVYIM